MKKQATAKLVLTDRQLATVLAALRYWQQDMIEDPDTEIISPHFEDHEPLTAGEIDDLCEELNTR